MLSVVLLDVTPVGHDLEIPRTILLTWEAHGCWHHEDEVPAHLVPSCVS